MKRSFAEAEVALNVLHSLHEYGLQIASTVNENRGEEACGSDCRAAMDEA